jgi:hypothetical protein
MRSSSVIAQAALAIVASGVVVSGLSACSIFDGWSDVQGGRAPLDAARGKDGAPDGEVSGDAAPAHEGLALCGATRCTPGQGCCFTNAGVRECTSRQVCEARGDSFLVCSEASSCPSTAPVCCFDFGDSVSSCVAGCGAGQYELCSIDDTKPCTATRMCTDTLPGVTGLPVCTK